MKIKLIIIISLITLTFTSCFSFPVKVAGKSSPENSIIYGYIGFENQGDLLDGVEIMTEERKVKVYMGGNVSDLDVIYWNEGAFFAADVKPDRYFLSAFYSLSGGLDAGNFLVGSQAQYNKLVSSYLPPEESVFAVPENSRSILELISMC